MWVDIQGFEGIYQLDEFGNIKSVITNELKNPYLNNKGYKCIDLYKDGKRYKYLIHRLVAIHFVPNPNNYPIVLHIDNVKTNTYYTNLQWGTYSENNAQAIRDGLNKVPIVDNRKYYKIFNESGDYILCYGTNQIIDTIGYGTESIIRNMLFRQTPIHSGEYAGYKVERTIVPFIIAK